MRKIIFIGFLSFVTAFLAQENKAALIALDSTWKKEIFPFPISFAPQLPYVGFEEARFPPKGWLDENHPNFWSYTFAWKIDAVDNLNAKKLSENLKVYFDGLSNNKDFKTSASIKKIKSANNIIDFKGSVTIYDRFTTNKSLTLNILIEKSFCKETEKSILLFKFSPKDFDHKTWQLLQKIELSSNVCS